jgi:hypothetical protein
MRTITMQPRGQLWFALEDVCRNFRDYSGLEKKEALELLVVVLTNLLAEQTADLQALSGSTSADKGMNAPE